MIILFSVIPDYIFFKWVTSYLPFLSFSQQILKIINHKNPLKPKGAFSNTNISPKYLFILMVKPYLPLRI